MSYGDSGINTEFKQTSEIQLWSLELDKTLMWYYHYRNLVERLARVNPTELSHNEKLAFWINIYNALIMHVILSLKFPRSLICRYKTYNFPIV